MCFVPTGFTSAQGLARGRATIPTPVLPRSYESRMIAHMLHLATQLTLGPLVAQGARPVRPAEVQTRGHDATTGSAFMFEPITLVRNATR